MDPDTFWDMTPREYRMAVLGWQRKQTLQHNQTAWHTCQIINSSGFLRDPVRYEDMIIREEETKAQRFNKVKAAFEEAKRDG